MTKELLVKPQVLVQCCREGTHWNLTDVEQNSTVEQAAGQ